MKLFEKYNKKFHECNTSLIDALSEDGKEYFEERAAIMEFDGGLTRDEAEREAMKLISGLRYFNNVSH